MSASRAKAAPRYSWAIISADDPKWPVISTLLSVRYSE